MDSKNIRSFIDIIRDASKADIIIVSLFLVPILLGSWSYLLNNIDFFNSHPTFEFVIICLVIGCYVLGIIIMKCWDSKEEKLKRARYHIENRIKNKPGTRGSFENIRNTVNSTYNDNFLKELIDKNPTVFRSVRIKKHGPGITLVDEKSDDE